MKIQNLRKILWGENMDLKKTLSDLFRIPRQNQEEPEEKPKSNNDGFRDGDQRECVFALGFNTVGMPIFECQTHTDGKTNRLTKICIYRLSAREPFNTFEKTR
jgi:hypothetical protein